MKQMTTNEIIAIFLTISGVTLLFMALFIAPMGVISDSVLWATGQLCALIGGLCGVSAHYGAKIDKIEKKIENENKL